MIKLALDILTLHGGSIESCVKDSTTRILELMNSPNAVIVKGALSNLMQGKLYLIKYNYNGMLIWCPIFSMDIKIKEGKPILYAINLDYLPYKYKVEVFGRIITEDVKDTSTVFEETPTKMSFETVYNIFKSNGGYNFALTAYDVSKITVLYIVSTKIAHRFIFLNTKQINSSSMEELYNNETRQELLTKIKNVSDKYLSLKELQSFDKELVNWDSDIKEYYKKLKALEEIYKLF